MLACVDVPALALQLVLRAHPDWQSDPVVVVEDDRPLAAIVWCNRAAREQRMFRGMSFSQAKALSAKLHAEVVPEHAVLSAIDALFEQLIAFSPRVEPVLVQPGLFWLDPQGLLGLFGSLQAWAASVHEALRAERYVSAVVVGHMRASVFALARVRTGPFIASDTALEQRLFVRVQLDRLGISPKLRDALALLDIHTVGELLELEAAQLRIRYGEEAARLHDFLSGKAWTPLLPRVPVAPFVLELEVDPPDDDCTRLLFGLKAALHGVVARLREEHSAITALELVWKLERLGERRDRIETAAPTLDVPQIVDLLRLRMSGVALPARVEQIVTTLEHTRVHARQIAIELSAAQQSGSEATLADGWVPDGFAGRAGRARALPDIKPGWVPDGFAGRAGRARALPDIKPGWVPDGFAGRAGRARALPDIKRDLEAGARAIARLRATFGPDAVSRVRLRDAYLPEAAFRFEPTRELRRPQPRARSASELPLVRRVYKTPIVLPPLPSHEPEAWLGRHGAVSAMFGPHRIAGGWWSPRGARERDYYFIETKTGELLWIFYDRARRRWLLHGTVE